jgi:hypothetical protein
VVGDCNTLIKVVSDKYAQQDVISIVAKIINTNLAPDMIEIYKKLIADKNIVLAEGVDFDKMATEWQKLKAIPIKKEEYPWDASATTKGSGNTSTKKSLKDAVNTKKEELLDKSVEKAGNVVTGLLGKLFS